MKILVAEDEKLLSDAVCHLLQEAGYFTDAVFNGRDAVYYATDASYNLIILDIMLPEMDGIEALQNIRRNNVETPILMLTAKSSIPDKVSALNAGADDYITKPFHTDELIARVNALMRRKGSIIINELTYGDLRLNLNSGSLQCGIHTLQLTKKEFDVARYLMSNSKITVTKESLIINIWEPNTDATENNVEAYISFLRKKLKCLKSRVTIRSVRKIGYRLEDNIC